MEGRTFNAYMPDVNHTWAARVLRMKLGEDPHRGPDLEDPTKIVEIKFKLVHDDRYTHVHWTTYAHQKAYENGRPGFWGVGEYTLKEEVADIETIDPRELEALVSRRELWVVPWDWVKQFPLYTQKARRNCRWYESDRFYPKKAKLPPVEETWKVSKGLVYLTAGVPSTLFNNIRGTKV